MEYVRVIIAWELFFIMVFASLLIIDSTGYMATGMAVQDVTKDSVLSELEKAIPKLDFLSYVGDTEACLIVNIDTSTKYSHQITKIGDAIAITSSNNLMCNGEESEDFIIFYISYDKLKEHLINIPTFEQLKQTSDGTNFYVYPSRQILSGMIVAYPDEFRDKYGALLEKYFTSGEIDLMLSPKTPEEREASAIAFYIFYFILGLLVLIVLITFIIMKISKKPELKEDLELVSYIKSMFSQGYGEEQIKQQLLQFGWQQDKIQSAFQTAKSEVILPPEFTS